MICELLNRVMNSEPSLTGRIDCILCLQLSILYFFVSCSCFVHIQKTPKNKNITLPFRTIYIVNVWKCSQVQNPKFYGWEPWENHLIMDYCMSLKKSVDRATIENNSSVHSVPSGKEQWHYSYPNNFWYVSLQDS